jgi:uncharacterized protein (DUF2384 family)
MEKSYYQELPGHLKKYVDKFGWSEEKINEWLIRPVPALGGRSIIQALSDGALQEVNNVVLKVGDAIGIESSFD